MTPLRTLVPALFLTVSLSLVLPVPLWAQEKDVKTPPKETSTPVKKEATKKVQSPALSREDRAVVRNLDLLQMMTLLKDLNVLAPTEEKK
jgi:hypothetical protein